MHRAPSQHRSKAALHRGAPCAPSTNPAWRSGEPERVEQPLAGLEGDTIWVSDLSPRAPGLFVFVMHGAGEPPLLPPDAPMRTNGHISHPRQQPCEHKQLCLPPQPIVLTMEAAFTFGKGSLVISSQAVEIKLTRFFYYYYF